jgi:hypothetical protein
MFTLLLHSFCKNKIQYVNVLLFFYFQAMVINVHSGQLFSTKGNCRLGATICFPRPLKIRSKDGFYFSLQPLVTTNLAGWLLI